MAEVVDFIDKVKRYYKFNPVEIRGVVLTTLALAFVISFREWGADSFEILTGLYNYLLAVIIVGVSLLVHMSGQRLWALATGYRVEYQLRSVGLYLAIILAFITNGGFWLLLSGGFMIHHMSGHRLGWFRYGVNYWALGLISFAGLIATITFMVLLKTISLIAPSAFLTKFIAFNAFYNIYCILPIPPQDGSKIFYGSRMLYGFSLPLVIASSALMFVPINPIITIIGSFIIAVFLWVLYYLLLEKNLWSL